MVASARAIQTAKITSTRSVYCQVPVHMVQKCGMTSRHILFQLTLFQQLLIKNKHDM